MKTFTIVIEETVSEEFNVEAADAKEALRIAESKYRECEFVLCPGNLQFKQMAVIKPEDAVTEFIEF